MPRNFRKTTRTRVPGILQTMDNSYVVIARWTCPRTGVRKKKEATAATFAEAVALQERLRHDEASATVNKNGTRLRFADFAEQWLSLHRERLAPSSRARYTVELAHWMAHVGELYVEALSTADIRRAAASMLTKARATTVNGRLRVIRQVLQELVDDGVLQHNPARSVKPFPQGRTRGPRGTALSAPEFARFVSTLEAMIHDESIAPDLGRMLAVVAWTGMRRGELFALRFTDWDEVQGELRIERSAWNKVLKGTKTDDPRRVAVVEPLAMILDEQRRWLREKGHPGAASGLIFPCDPARREAAHARFLEADPNRRKRMTEEESWLRSPTCLQGPLAKVLARSGVPRLSPHGFRRTAENLARRAGVDELVRRAHAGWRSETAQAIYATVDASERRAAGEAVVALVERARDAAQLVRPPGTPALPAVEAEEGSVH